MEACDFTIFGNALGVQFPVQFPALITKPLLLPLFHHPKVTPMPAPRLIIPHRSDGTLPDLATHHVTSHVVHRQFLF